MTFCLLSIDTDISLLTEFSAVRGNMLGVFFFFKKKTSRDLFENVIDNIVAGQSPSRLK